MGVFGWVADRELNGLRDQGGKVEDVGRGLAEVMGVGG